MTESQKEQRRIALAISGGANAGGGLGNNCEVRRLTRAERNEKLHRL